MKIRTLPAAFVLILIALGTGVQAQEQTAQQGTPEIALPEQGDVRIIVDISGSMKANDPDNLRQPAVRLLARMLPEGTDAGIWTFGQWVNMLVPHGSVNDAWREDAIAKSTQINSVALRTNLGEAIAKASDAYLGGEDLGSTDFILLTDGKVDLSDDPEVNAEERGRILGPLLAGLKQRGATLHTVALSEQADLQMLEALAAETGGHYSLVSSADGLNRAFLKSLNAAVPQEQIPLDEEGFTVDEGVEEFTALIFWGEDETSSTRSLEMINPDGTRYTKDSVADNMRWAAETGYDLITVTGPGVGQWMLNGELGEGSRVTVVSDLRMVVSPVPPSFTADEPISLKIAFFEEDARIQDSDFLNVIEVVVRLTASDGRSGSKVLSGNQPPEDGVYVDDIESLPAPGDYEIEVIADGTTFSRRFSGVTRFIIPEGEVVTTEEPSAEQKEPSPASEEPAGEPEQAVDSPIDISAAEEPPADDEPAEEAQSSESEPASGTVPLWIWGLGGGLGLVAIAAGVWFWLRRKKEGAEPEQESEAEENPTPPVVEPDPEPEPEIKPEPEPEPEIEQEDEPALDSEPEPELEDDEEIPELEPEAAPEPEAEPDPEELEDDDEFGLEDFDLSEFDDLPGADDPEDNPDDNGKSGKS